LFSLWKDVTYSLKSKQLDKATGAKSFLEQRQREEAKERAEKSIKWQTKVKPTKIVLIFNSICLFFSISLNQANKNGAMKIN
jgi:hypothetical protein